MFTKTNNMKKQNDVGLLMIRLIIAGPMFLYGIGKVLNGIDFIKSMLAEFGMPQFIACLLYTSDAADE